MKRTIVKKNDEGSGSAGTSIYGTTLFEFNVPFNFGYLRSIGRITSGPGVIISK
jgi:hypothetical protein